MCTGYSVDGRCVQRCIGSRQNQHGTLALWSRCIIGQHWYKMCPHCVPNNAHSLFVSYILDVSAVISEISREGEEAACYVPMSKAIIHNSCLNFYKMYQQIFIYTIYTTITQITGITEIIFRPVYTKLLPKKYLEEAVFLEIIAKFSKWC